MKLIRELTETVEVLVEGSGAEKQYYVHGVCLQAGIKNKNNRIYPPPVLEREVSRYVEEQVKAKCAWGELGHPDSPKLNEDRISHRFVHLERDGDNWIGKAVVCDTRNGRDVIGMIKSGGRLGISSRGLGSLRTDEKTGIHTVCDDYRLVVGGDIVLNPSAPAAWLDSVVEGADWWQDEKGEWRTGVREVREQVRSMSSSQLRDKRQLGRLFEQFVEALARPEPKNLARELARQANVSERRVRELWESSDHDLELVKKRLGLK